MKCFPAPALVLCSAALLGVSSGCGSFAGIEKKDIQDGGHGSGASLEKESDGSPSSLGKIDLVCGRSVFPKNVEGGERVKRECCLLYLLAKEMGLPKRIWVGNILICGKREKGEKEKKGKYVVYRVENVWLEFFNLRGFLERIVEDPSWGNFFLQPSFVQSFHVPFVDPNEKKVFALVYKIRKGPAFPSMEAALSAVGKGAESGNWFPPPNPERSSIPGCRPKEKPFWAGEKLVNEGWFEKRVVKVIRGPGRLAPHR